jgi:hypothetical protein
MLRHECDDMPHAEEVHRAGTVRENHSRDRIVQGDKSRSISAISTLSRDMPAKMCFARPVRGWSGG